MTRKTLCYSSLGLVLLVFLGVVKPNFAAYDDCCPPPALNPAAARFQPGAQVTVFLDTTTGFTATELQAIKVGLEDWNDEPDNSGVDYNVVETDNPPAPAGNNTVIVTYTDQFSSGTGGAIMNMADQRNSNGVVTNVSATLKFFKNIRSGTPSFYLRFCGRRQDMKAAMELDLRILIPTDVPKEATSCGHRPTEKPLLLIAIMQK